MCNGIPKLNFKIGLSLFGCAEKYTEQSTHRALETLQLLAKFYRKNKHEDDVDDVSILWCGPRPSRGRCLSAAALPASSPLGP